MGRAVKTVEAEEERAKCALIHPWWSSYDWWRIRGKLKRTFLSVPIFTLSVGLGRCCVELLYGTVFLFFLLAIFRFSVGLGRCCVCSLTHLRPCLKLNFRMASNYPCLSVTGKLRRDLGWANHTIFGIRKSLAKCHKALPFSCEIAIFFCVTSGDNSV